MNDDFDSEMSDIVLDEHDDDEFEQWSCEWIVQRSFIAKWRFFRKVLSRNR